MSGALVVAAHGFRADGPTIPTHVRTDMFESWVNDCRRIGAGLGDAARFLNGLAFAAEKGQKRLEPIGGPVLSFDDALESIDTVADAISVPAIVFVVVGHVGRFNDWQGQPGWVPRERCMGWPRIRELASQGWLVGAHSIDHPHLGRCTVHEQRRQIEGSKKTIEDRLGQPCPLFAYPYGDAPASARAIVRENGMIGFGMSAGLVCRRSDRVCLPRVDLFDLVRPGVAHDWAWSRPGAAGLLALRLKRTLGRFVPRGRAA
jgi:hypothetical protein